MFWMFWCIFWLNDLDNSVYTFVIWKTDGKLHDGVSYCISRCDLCMSLFTGSKFFRNIHITSENLSKFLQNHFSPILYFWYDKGREWSIWKISTCLQHLCISFVERIISNHFENSIMKLMGAYFKRFFSIKIFLWSSNFKIYSCHYKEGETVRSLILWCRS